MKKSFFPLAFLTMAVLAACGTPRNHYEPNFSGTLAETRYVCADGTILPVRFESRVAVARLWDGTEIIMDQQPAASGFHYASAHYQLRGKGRHADWTVGMNRPVSCRG